MKCPRCGAENSPQAEQCYLCELPLRDRNEKVEGDAAGARQVPAGAAQPPQSSAAATPPPSGPPVQGPQGAPTPYYTGQAPPPGRRSKGIKILLAVLAGLGILAVVAVFLFLGLDQAPTIQVDAPPGWEEASEETRQDFQEASEIGGGDVAVDHLFTDGSPSNVITVAHGQTYIMDKPESESFEDVEDFFTRHQQELEEEFESAYGDTGASVDMSNYSVEKLACGLASLHLTINIESMGNELVQDFLFFFKDNTSFFALVNTLGAEGNQEYIDFLKDSISFE